MSETTNNKTDAMMYGSLPSSANYEREIIVELRKEVERLGQVLRASQSAALENQSEVFRLRAENERLRKALLKIAIVALEEESDE